MILRVGNKLVYFNFLLISIALFIVIIGMISLSSSSNRSQEWKPISSMKPKKLIDGTRSAGVLMTRTVNGEKQYRQMTQDEAKDAIVDRW